MNWVERHIGRIMQVSGLLTCSMVFAALAPQAALVHYFGNGLEGPVADVVVRSWGALIGLVGAMLLYAAQRPELRPLVLAVAGSSKLVFVALVLSHGRLFLPQQVGIAVLLDGLWALVYAAYLVRPQGEARS
ncbi:hypothetical protein [Rhodoferax sp.]|uniref:hypothetical protein n=1 Tax=Rhodoferax sp. TaxID=50421 RepID=UPI002ACE42F6|nr:hypothetical protein [Rhodoferax sp.]MDZ7919847.1 hypothetical protein [Rhodoferax sp.]